MANAAFYYGMLRTLSEEDRPLWTKMSFAAAHHNFLEAARMGWTAGCTGPAWEKSRPTSWCCASCCRWPMRDCAAGESRVKCATYTSA